MTSSIALSELSQTKLATVGTSGSEAGQRQWRYAAGLAPTRLDDLTLRMHFGYGGHFPRLATKSMDYERQPS